MQDNATNIRDSGLVINPIQLILDVWDSLRRQGWIILTLISIVGTICFFTARIRYTPYYEAYTTFTVNSVSTVSYNSRSQKNTATNKMGKVFPYILTSDALKAIVIEDMGYKDAKNFPAEINASVVKDTNLVELTVKSSDPQFAYDTLRSVLRNYPSISNVAIGKVALKQMKESGLPKEPANKDESQKTAAIGMLLVLMASVVWFIIKSLTRKTIRTEDELTRYFNAEYLGNLPSVVFKRRNKKQEPVVTIDTEKIPFAFIEAVRTIRHRVEREAQKYGAKTILLTSALQSEGKTTMSTNLAIALANREHNVLLVDGDLRNPSVLSALGLGQSEQGMVDLLSGKCDIKDILMSYKNRKHLKILPGGKAIENPSALWSNKNTKKLLRSLRDQYDFIIIDAPPSAIVSDASLIAGLSDGCVYVVRQDYAEIDTLREGMEMFSGTGCKLLGCVLNHAEASGGGYGYGRYGYGKYGYGKYGYGKSGYGYGYGASNSNKNPDE